MSYIFHPHAESEHLESIAFYEMKRAGLGASYLADFEATLKLVCNHPQRYPVETEPNIRKVRMNRFPYNILFRHQDGEVQVLAVAHKRRHPAYWQNRV